MQTTIEEICAVLGDTTPQSDFGQILEDQLKAMGFERFAYRSVSPDGRPPIAYSNYPIEWQALYVDGRYGGVDPVVISARQSILPFRWGEAEDVRPRNQQQRNFFSQARDFGLSRGICVPVHGAGRDYSALVLSPDRDQDDFFRLSDSHGSTLHLLALHFHSAIEKLRRVGCPEEPVVHLTPRELECLTWTAHGKTSWEVSRILGISDGTVVFHLKNVMRKFGVFNKHHAVVKAIMKGLIEL